MIAWNDCAARKKLPGYIRLVAYDGANALDDYRTLENKTLSTPARVLIL